MSQVLLVTGPPGAGKTTVCKEFARTADGDWAYVSQDDVHDFIYAGYESANDFYENWNDDTKRQWKVGIEICCDLVKDYYENDIHCVVDFFATPAEFEKWRRHLEEVPYQIIVLLPNEATTIQRNNQRSVGAKLKEAKVRLLHSLQLEWAKNDTATLIDNTDSSVENTVMKIKELVAEA